MDSSSPAKSDSAGRSVVIVNTYYRRYIIVYVGRAPRRRGNINIREVDIGVEINI